MKFLRDNTPSLDNHDSIDNVEIFPNTFTSLHYDLTSGLNEQGSQKKKKIRRT